MSEENELVKMSRNSIRAMVELLRNRRGILYVGEPSIECLAAFISGWLWALSDHAADMEVWNNFLDFVTKKYEDGGQRSWNALILFHARTPSKRIETSSETSTSPS